MSDIALMHALGRVAAGRQLNAAMPSVSAASEDLARALDYKVFALIDAGELTPERAFAAWIERRTLFNVSRKLTQTVNGAEAVGQRFQSFLEETNRAMLPEPNKEQDNG